MYRCGLDLKFKVKDLPRDVAEELAGLFSDFEKGKVLAVKWRGFRNFYETFEKCAFNPHFIVCPQSKMLSAAK